MLPEPYAILHRELGDFIPAERIIHDPLRTFIYGTDASFYRLVPKLIVFVETEEEVSRILRLVRQHGIAVTFRAAGTSLSGQAITDSVLLMLGWGWRNYRINEDASRITLQPGIIGAWANRYLAPFNRKIGPDPASINTAGQASLHPRWPTGWPITSPESLPVRACSWMELILHTPCWVRH